MNEVEWYHNLYVGPEANKKKKKIIRDIKKNKFQFDVYLITLSHHESNLMEIIPSSSLLQSWHREHCPQIIGIADGKMEAVEMVRAIIDELYQNTGGFNVKQYLAGK